MQVAKKIKMETRAGLEPELILNDEKRNKSIVKKMKNIFKSFNEILNAKEEVNIERKENKNFNKKVSIRNEEFNSQVRAMMFVR